ncbi:MAG: hypothetical protein U0894_11495 [Pirellulales bacterium]
MPLIFGDVDASRNEIALHCGSLLFLLGMLASIVSVSQFFSPQVKIKKALLAGWRKSANRGWFVSKASLARSDDTLDARLVQQSSRGNIAAIEDWPGVMQSSFRFI